MAHANPEVLFTLSELRRLLPDCIDALDALYSDAGDIPYAYWQSKSAINAAIYFLKDSDSRGDDDTDLVELLNLMDEVDRELSYLPHKQRTVRAYRKEFSAHQYVLSREVYML